METPSLGTLIGDSNKRRDAVHIAVAPVTAAADLSPGQHVGFVPAGQSEFVGLDAEQLIGIVDPFLTGRVHAGERFWLFLYPNSITSLRHVWTHPAFVPRVPSQAPAAMNER